jgi:hypothetical protein
VNWRIIAVHVLLPQEGGWYPLQWVPADLPPSSRGPIHPHWGAISPAQTA